MNHDLRVVRSLVKSPGVLIFLDNPVLLEVNVSRLCDGKILAGVGDKDSAKRFPHD